MSRLLCLTELPRRGQPLGGYRRRDCQSPLTESNRRPSPYHGDALPTELRGRAPVLLAPTDQLTRPVAPSDRPPGHSTDPHRTSRRARDPASQPEVPRPGPGPLADHPETLAT